MIVIANVSQCVNCGDALIYQVSSVLLQTIGLKEGNKVVVKGILRSGLAAYTPTDLQH